MLPYYTLLAGILLAGIPLSRTLWGRRVFAFTMTVVFSMMAGLRFSVGWDFTSYVTFFGVSPFVSLESIYSSKTEKGYALLNRILAEVSIDLKVILFAVGIVVAVGFMMFLYRFATPLWLGTFLFVALGFYYNSFCFMRQIIAAVVMLWALRYIHERRFLRYALLVVLASCFHLSAVVMLPLYFAAKIPITRTVLAVYSFISILIFTYSYQIIDLVTTVFYKTYVPTNVHVIKGLNWVYFGFSLAMFLLCFVLRKSLWEMRPLNKTLLSLMFFATLLDLIAVKHSIISRVGVLFMAAPTLILMCDSFVVLTEKLRNYARSRSLVPLADFAGLIVGVGFVTFALVFHHILLLNNYNGVVPYRIH